MRSLIIEDDKLSRLKLSALLEDYGPVHFASTGEEAIHMVSRAFIFKDGYDLICIDYALPGITGGDILQMIRSIEKDEKKKPIIFMVTAKDDRKTVIESFRCQCEAYLIKPIDPDLLDKHLCENELISVVS